MRRVGLALTAAAILTFLPASGAFAGPSPSDSAAPAATVCTISDTAVNGLTGLAATGDGYAVVTGARAGVPRTSQHAYLLDSSCNKKATLNFSGGGSRDPQDLTVAKDGTIWVADTGDPTGERPNIAVWKVPADGGTSTIYRMTYPDGQHPDAEALLMGADGIPILITKGISGPAAIFQASGALDANKPVALKSVGTFTPEKTSTPTKLGAGGAAAMTVTGAALSTDGKKVAIRTLTDAYVWDVADGGVVAAITSNKYRITPLPNEPNGSAIAFTADGTKLLSLSSITDGQTPRTVLAYTPATPAANTPSAGTPGGGTGGSSGGSTSWFGRLSFTDLTYIIGVIGVIGLLMIVGGILGIKRSRTQQRQAARRSAADPDDWDDDADPGYDRGQPSRGGYEDPYGDPYGEPAPPSGGYYGDAAPVGGGYYADPAPAGAGYYPEPAPPGGGSYYAEPDAPAERHPAARPGGRRAEPAGYSSTVYGGTAGDDYDAGYPETYGSGYSGAPYPPGGAPSADYPSPDYRDAEHTGGSRRGSRDTAGSWTDDEPGTDGGGRARPGVIPSQPDGPPRPPRTEPRRSTGRATPTRPNTWADEHEGFGDLRG